LRKYAIRAGDDLFGRTMMSIIIAILLYLFYGCYLIFKILTEGNSPLYMAGSVGTYSDLAWIWWLGPLGLVLFVLANNIINTQKRVRASRMLTEAEISERKARTEQRKAIINQYPLHRRWWHLGMGTAHSNKPLK
jgi:hypothetical protein